MNPSPPRSARRSSVRRRSAAAAAVAGLIVAGGATPAASTAEVTTSRVAGPDRYATAAQLSLRAESRPNAAVVLARGDSPFDALSAAGLAGALFTGILLTTPGGLPAATAEELRAYGAPGDVDLHIVGGTASVSQGVRDGLRSQGYTLVEHAGADRYATAGAVRAEVDRVRVELGASPADTVILANGVNAADALSIGSVAYHFALPILLTQTDSLPAASNPNGAEVLIVGGTVSVSDALATQVDAGNGEALVTRVAGDNRYATATEIAERFCDESSAVLVRGDGANFADALVAATYAGSRDTDLPLPILLTSGPGAGDLPAASAAWLGEIAPTITSIVAIGGPAVISEAALDAAARAAGRR